MLNENFMTSSCQYSKHNSVGTSDYLSTVKTWSSSVTEAIRWEWPTYRCLDLHPFLSGNRKELQIQSNSPKWIHARITWAGQVDTSVEQKKNNSRWRLSGRDFLTLSSDSRVSKMVACYILIHPHIHTRCAKKLMRRMSQGFTGIWEASPFND